MPDHHSSLQPPSPQFLEQDIHRLGTQQRTLPAKLEELLALWHVRCEGKSMPYREHLPNENLRPWYGNLALFEIGDSDFRVRLCGTNLIRRFGREATGLWIAELAGDIRIHLRAVLEATIRAQGPVVATSAVQLGRATHWHCEVTMPLKSHETRRGLILLGSYPVALS